MHHSQNAPYLSLTGKNCLESLASGARVLKSAIHQTGPATNHLLQFGTQCQFSLLRIEEYAHQSKGIFVKDLSIFIINEVSMTVETVEMFSLQFPFGQKTKDRTCLFFGLSWNKKAFRDPGSS